MLTKIPYFKRKKEAKEQEMVRYYRSLIEKNKAYYAGYIEMAGWKADYDFAFTKPQIYATGGGAILRITEWKPTHFSFECYDLVYAGSSYDGFTDHYDKQCKLVMKIEHTDPLYEKIKVNLEEDKKRIKTSLFNHRLNELESLQQTLQTVRTDIEKVKAVLQRKQSTLRAFENKAFAFVSLKEEKQLDGLEREEVKVELAIKQTKHEMEVFDFNMNIFLPH